MKTKTPKIPLSIIEILLTDHCNQSCPFCFARKEMKSAKKKEMSEDDFRLILKRARENNIGQAALTGGEPTLHPKFADLLRLALESFPRIHINTNGTFSAGTEKALLAGGNRISVLFNISTPGFVFNKKIRDKVIGHLRVLAPKIKVVLVVTSKFLTAVDAKAIIDLVPEDIMRQATLRLGVEGTIAGEKNFTTIKDFPRIGKFFYQALTYVETKKRPRALVFGKSIVPCMFTKKQFEHIMEMGYIKSYHCHPEMEDRWFGITPSLSTFMCYPLSTIDRFAVDKETDFRKLKDTYTRLQASYQTKYALPECLACPFYGLTEDKCPGPCAGFKMNELASSSFNH